MKIVNAGYNYRHPSDFCINRPDGSGDYILLLIRTEAYVYFDGVRQDVPKNSAIVFKKGTPQHYGAVEAEYVNDWIHFELDEGEAGRIGELGVPFDRVLPLFDITELCGFIKCIFSERYSENAYKSDSMKSYFDLIFYKLAEGIYKTDPVLEHPYYSAFCALRGRIQTEPQLNWSVDGVGRELNLSRSYAQHLYKLFFGVSIVRDVQEYRMERAKHLLGETDASVSEIAAQCGYSTDVHFMRLFKKLTGLTPSEFRTTHRLSSSELARSRFGFQHSEAF